MSADRVLFIGWNRPIPGREKVASELFNSVIAYLGKQQAAGANASFEPVILTAHGGDMNGFVLVRGTFDKLSTLSNQDEYLTLVTACAVNVENFGTIIGFGGEGVMKQMERW